MLTWTLRIVAALVVLFVMVRIATAVSFAAKPDPAAGLGTQPVMKGAAGGEPQLNALLEPIRAKHKVPALGGALVTSEGLVEVGVVGVRFAGGNEAVTIDDQWHIGSCTKSMTATLCAILVEKKKLSWKTTLAEVFPDLAPHMHEEFRTVTVEQLCTNRGGVPTDLNADGLWGKLWSHKGTPTETRRLLLESVTSRAPGYEPGSKFVYSNGGFAIAGHICETVMAKPYEELITDLLFKPLGMTSAGFGAPGIPGQADQPRGHTRDGKPQEPTPDGRGADNPPAISPAGRVHCTLADWAKYIQLHLRGARGEGGTDQNVGDVTIKGAAFKKMHTPPVEGEKSDYAMGWGRPERPWGGPPGDRFVLTHNGSNTMWFAVVWITPARDFAAMAVCNSGERGDKATDEAVWGMIQSREKAQGK